MSQQQFKIAKSNSENQQFKQKQISQISLFRLFRYARKLDYFLVTLGTIASLMNGVPLPFFGVIFGQITLAQNPQNGFDDYIDKIGQLCLYFIYIGIITFILSYISFFCWIVVGERQTIMLRRQYMRALLRQDISWFDQINPSILTTKIQSEMDNVQQAIGVKLAIICQTFSMLLSGFIIGYIYGWQLSLVLTSILPIMGFSSTIYSWSIRTQTAKSQKAYEEAGGIADQAINQLKTVIGLTGEQQESTNYQNALFAAKQATLKLGLISGSCLGLMIFSIFGCYTLGLWYGSKLIDGKVINDNTNLPYTIGDVLKSFYAIRLGALQLEQIGPCLKAFAQGKASGTQIMQIIDRKPQINIEENKGLIFQQFNGNFKLQNVDFSYPSRPSVKILNNININIESGQKIALVGESGCGKSTIVQLLERFYDPQNGTIEVDGYDIKSLNLQWLRSKIGYVGQEPVLFATSIRENLLIAKSDATETDIIQVLKDARAYDFVMSLEKGLDTYVGSSGSQLSGGQKQRLAIARALLKKPNVLFLDEATSALDRTNEQAIQHTLDEVSQGLTTIIIAHRLSTIQMADKIIVIDQGQVLEQGSHQQLINLKGKYYQLYQLYQKQCSLLEYNSGVNITRAQDQSNCQILDLQISVQNNKKSENNQFKQVNEKDQILKEDKKRKYQLIRLFKLSKPEKWYLLLGSVMGILQGTIFPFFAIIFAEMLEVLTIQNTLNFEDSTSFLSLMLFTLAIFAFITATLEIWSMNIVGENLTFRLRKILFNKILHMDCSWHDLPQNSPSNLIGQLASETQIVNQLVSTHISLRLQSISSLVTGIIIAFIASWQLAFIALGLSPFMIIFGSLHVKFIRTFNSKADQSYNQSSKLIIESINNIRTISALSTQQYILKLYDDSLIKPKQSANKKGHISGLLLGISQLALFFTYGIIFYFGAIMRTHYGLSLKDMYLAMFAIVFGSYSSGSSMQFMGDVGKAEAAMNNLFGILDSQTKINVKSSQIIKNIIKGKIEFKNIQFKYPTRDIQILKGVSFLIQPGQKIAIVGPSGCGKSTIIQLLMRYYDADSGDIFIDDVNIKNIDLIHLRQQIGLVSQEPVLFNGTIEYNIKYTKNNASLDEVKEAARKANALEFIEKNDFEIIPQNKKQQNLGQGFQKKVGSKGSQISGGQKQRIAIARAVMKKPSIYLFDEATSALDNRNEKIVQESLDNIIQNKTCITVAHRFTTIRNVDVILVMKDGQIIETGTYNELSQNQLSYFYKLEQGITELV